jgi:catechol 2,3-dioxygenase-like lactoylglutathione lyase family enzyme
MQGLIGLLRVHLKQVVILLAMGLALQLAWQRAHAQDQPKRPRITGIDHVRVYVSNLGKSVDFYTRSCGLPASGGNCIGSAVPCFPISAQQQIELYPALTPAHINWIAEVAYTTDDIEAMHRYLAAHGIETSPIAKDPTGARRFELHDPEGNALAFVERGRPSTELPASLHKVGTRLFHAGFVVKDVASENKFYLDLLGFRLYWQGGFKDDGLDWYEIQVPDGENWIEYMLNIPANADHKELGVQNHFSLGVKDIHATAEQLRKNGLANFDGPEIGRDGKWALDAYDPDGTRVEFMEFTPAKDPCCHPYTAPHPKL